MKKVILCSDRTCDLNEELIKATGVHLVPYHITLDGKEYSDNVDITTEDIYKAYWDKKILPKTSALNIGDLTDFWKPFIDDGCEVVHINLGSAITSTYRNCLLAAGDLNGVYVVDSQNLSTGSGHLVLEAARMIDEGMCAADIAKALNELAPTVHSSFVLDTLEFMAAGGRCSTVAALGANLLKLKPSVIVDSSAGGAMKVAKKYRGDFAKVLPQYVKDMLGAYDNIRTDKIFITFTAVEQRYIDIVTQTVKETLDFDKIYYTEASCTIGCHCGPNCIGILFMTEK